MSKNWELSRFLKLNKRKVFYALKVCSIIFGIIPLVFLSKKLITNDFENIINLIASVLIFGVIIPLMIISIAYLEWKIKTWRRNKAYTFLDKCENSTLLIDSYLLKNDTKLYFTEELKKIKSKNLWFLIEVSNKNEVFLFPLIDESKNIFENMILFDEISAKSTFSDDELNKTYSLKELKNPLKEMEKDMISTENKIIEIKRNNL
jgi:hypothetical protein